ncbi:MAG: hypothetical protein K2K64_07155 [Muribaculaceae bacterium]|nr:hypothetical protein [Muribaculaceae bacterium]MDE7110248.1 hypothetical protein [Muribaculaceae bacterium]
MRKFTGRLIIYLLSILLLTGETGCIHTYPKGEPDDPTLVTASLSLTLDISLSHVGEPTNTPLELPGGLYRFLITVSRENRNEVNFVTTHRIAGGSIQDVTVTLPALLKQGKHEVTVWCDLVESVNETPLHYNADNLSAISILPFTEGVTATPAKLAPPLCACTAREIDLRGAGRSVTVPLSLTPPIGMIRIEATDAAVFLRHYPEAAFSADAYTATLAFTSPVGCTYNIFSGHPAAYTSGYEVASSLLITETSSPVILNIPVFPDPEGEDLTADLIIYDKARQIVARTKGITIPVMPDRTCVVRGEFLSNFFESPLKVEFEWEGEIIIDHKQ